LGFGLICFAFANTIRIATGFVVVAFIVAFGSLKPLLIGFGFGFGFHRVGNAFTLGHDKIFTHHMDLKNTNTICQHQCQSLTSFSSSSEWFLELLRLRGVISCAAVQTGNNKA
jgi:hypothetical protein